MLVQHFAASLGWRGIERSDVTITPDSRGNVSVGTVVTCWSTNDLKFFIQINQATPGQFGVYNVSVVAERYHVGPMDFVTCNFQTVEEAHSEAQRLSPLFARANFRDKRRLRRYLEQHPDKLLPGRKKWRGWKGRLHTKPKDAPRQE